MRSDIGFVGTIRTVEVTYGRNGWHPHVHAVVLNERPLEVDQEAARSAGVVRGVGPPPGSRRLALRWHAAEVKAHRR
jgi:hypothetical protein